jgi:hypothetical protein
MREEEENTTPPPPNELNNAINKYTPHKNKKNAHVTPYATGDDDNRNQRLRRDAHELEHYWVPLKFREFMNEFLPASGIRIVDRDITSLLGGVQEIGRLKENELLKNLVRVVANCIPWSF